MYCRQPDSAQKVLFDVGETGRLSFADDSFANSGVCASLLALTLRNAEPEVLGVAVADSIRTRVDGATLTTNRRKTTRLTTLPLTRYKQQSAAIRRNSSTIEADMVSILIGDTQRTTVTRTLLRWCGGNAHGGPVLQYELNKNLSNALEFDDDELQCIED